MSELNTGTTSSLQPNFIILMTDQQRTIQHFPDDWVRENLPNLQFFLDHGVVFANHHINTTPCGPSRASLFSGLYPATNGVSGNQDTLQPQDMNFVNVLAAAGYEIYYKGKFHMYEETTVFSQNWNLTDRTLLEMQTGALQGDALLQSMYNINGWTSPDFGTSLVEANPTPAELANLAGGMAGVAGQNDDRVVCGTGLISPPQESVLDFLKRIQGPDVPDTPFCLVVSLLNPHDVSLFPDGYANAGYEAGDFENITGIAAPDSYRSDDLSQKPQVQKAYLDSNEPLTKQADADNYARFYAYLHTLSDQLLGQVFNEIGGELLSNTIVIRMADHGEMGMAHGGLKEKMFTMYNETVKTPMIWYHPTWFKTGRRNTLVSLIDLVPTLGTLAGVDVGLEFPQLQGQSYHAALYDDGAAEPDRVVLFEFSNEPHPTAPASPVIPPIVVNQVMSPGSYPNNIYGIVSGNCKYAVYFSYNPDNSLNWTTAQFELYDMDADPHELCNLLPVGNPAPTQQGSALWPQLHKALTDKLAESGIVVEGWSNFVPPASGYTANQPTG